MLYLDTEGLFQKYNVLICLKFLREGFFILVHPDKLSYFSYDNYSPILETI
jgi:hypothetical protein